MKPILLSPPDVRGRELELVAQVFADNYIAPAGPMLERFEKEICALTGINYALAVNSGTAALHLALRCLGVEAGDQVWTSSMTFIGGVSPILYQSAEPTFFDLNSHDWLMDLDLVEEQLNASAKRNQLPKAIVSTDLYGQACDLERLSKLGSRYGIKIISDSAEALGAFRNNRHAGSLADAAVLSFNGNKIITSSGGGMLMSSHKKLIDHALKLSTQARESVEHYEHNEVGYNYRMSAVAAAIGVGQLEQIKQKIANRRKIFDRYAQAFSRVVCIDMMPKPAECNSTHWLSCIRFTGPNASQLCAAVKAKCQEQKIEVRSLWKPMHMQPVFANSKFVGGGFCEKLFHTGVCLPSGSGMLQSEQDRVIAVLMDAASQP